MVMGMLKLLIFCVFLVFQSSGTVIIEGKPFNGVIHPYETSSVSFD